MGTEGRKDERGGELVCQYELPEFTNLEDAKYEANSTSRAQCMNISCANGCDTETKGSRWDEPTRANIFAKHVAWDLEDNVRYVKDRKKLVVVVACELQILL